MISTNTQRTEAWHMVRLGKFTGSQVGNLLVQPRSKADKEAGLLSETAKSYIFEKVVEQITGIRKDFSSPATDWGTMYEPEAIALYESRTFIEVDSCGYIPYNDESGGSPDGLIGTEGMIEVKCPYNVENHFKNLLLDEGDFQNEYKLYYSQIQMNLLATNRQWCDFVSYGAHEQIPDDLRMRIIHIYRDEDHINLLKDAIAKAVEYKYQLITKLQKL